MWTIEQLKNRGKTVFHQSYWRSVLAALVLTIAAGGANITSRFRNLNLHPWGQNFHATFNNDGYEQSFEFGPDFEQSIENLFQSPSLHGIWPLLFGIFGVIILVGILFVLVLRIFVFSPLEVGAERFFIVNRYTQGDTTDLSNIVYPFAHGYLQVVKTMFLRELYIFLWSLLFIIPGIIKGYSYRLVAYIMAENPEMESREAFRLSKLMMDGEKWHAFCLDLSFLGWYILNAMTLGILGLFYVHPYKAATNAELYATLKEKIIPSNPYEQNQNTEQTFTESEAADNTTI